MRDDYPEITPEMEANGQVWVWLWDEPEQKPQFFHGGSGPVVIDQGRRRGHWDIRGTGLKLEDRDS